MLMEKRYLISDLADLAGVSPRTIRYYTDEGLIPQPEVDGKYGYYTNAHLVRLQLIKQLKDNFLPLREIRQLLTGMTDEQVEQQVGKNAMLASNGPELMRSMVVPSEPPTGMQGGEAGSAMEYIARVLGGQNAVQTTRVEEGSTVYRREAHPAPATMAGTTLRSMEGTVEQWEKVKLAEGVELMVRQPPDKQAQYAIQQLILLARKLFR